MRREGRYLQNVDINNGSRHGECVQENAIYAIHANATKTVHEINSAISIASFMNGTSVSIIGLRPLL